MLGLVVLIPTLTFLLFALLPSDPIRLTLGINASEEAVAQLRSELGYDRPLVVRLVSYLWSIFHLDFGRSLVTRRPVAPEVLEAYGITLGYVATALMLSVLASLTFLLAAHFGGTRIRLGVLFLVRGLTSLPSVVVAISVGLIVFASSAEAFIAQTDLRNLIMASVALAVYPSCSLGEIAILASDAVARQPYVTAARSFGFSEMRVFWHYIFRSSVLPWLGHLSNVAASLVTGSIVVEAVFSLPGLGRLVIQSVLRSDFPMMQAVVITGVMSFLAINVATEQAVARLFTGHR